MTERRIPITPAQHRLLMGLHQRHVEAGHALEVALQIILAGAEVEQIIGQIRFAEEGGAAYIAYPNGQPEAGNAPVVTPFTGD